MDVALAQRIVAEAVRRQRVLAVDYVRHDGTRTTRLLEPYDIGPSLRAHSTEQKLWGWCRDHNRIEQRTIANIISMQITEIPITTHEHRVHSRSGAFS